MFQPFQNPLLAQGWRDTAMMFGPSATARAAVKQPSVVSLQFSEVRHVLWQHFDPRDHVADLSMTVFSRNKSPPDILCLYAARALRGFGDGFAIIILPVYLSAIGFSPQLIGIVASASLLGTAALTLIVGFIAPRFELRSLFLAGAGLIALTGLVFPATATLAPVLLVAFIGSINPSGGDLGMLVPLEHALLTKEIADRDRTVAFARYSLIRSLTGAVGSLAAALPELLASNGWPKLTAIKLMFYGYAPLGVLAAFLYLRLPRDHTRTADVPEASLGPSRNIVYRLRAPFILDAFAGRFGMHARLRPPLV